MEAKETGEAAEDEAAEKQEEQEEQEKPLPPKVELALAKAREAVKADHARKSGRWLAAIPLGIAFVLLSLMMPRSTRPDGIPLPRVDRRVTAAIAKADDALANEAEETRLPGDVLEIGTAVRDLNAGEAGDDAEATTLARLKLEKLVTSVVRRKDSERDLLALRALQTRSFLRAVEEWEAGAEPKDFLAAGGGFVQRAEQAGWVKDRRVMLDETQRRVAFKTVWNAVTHLDTKAFALTLDEERALYAFYIQHPRVPENAREIVAGRLRDAKTPEACARARAETRRQEEAWRTEKIKRLGMIDPSYPTDYALGISYFQGGRSDLAVEAFGNFLQAHPDGAYAARAKNHMKAALVGVEP
ncbi:MAG: hypothetical protein KIT84_04575 [Labilithrix sp.]|nr:hypothetical protein [Labilithrix sp.]MCW5810261.1 hypothetical protein [Labilithrix sp.]